MSPLWLPDLVEDRWMEGLATAGPSVIFALDLLRSP